MMMKLFQSKTFKVVAGLLIGVAGIALLFQSEGTLDLEGPLRECAQGIASKSAAAAEKCILSHELSAMGVPEDNHDQVRKIVLEAFPEWDTFSQVETDLAQSRGKPGIMALQAWRMTGPNGKSFDTAWLAHNVDGKAGCALVTILSSAKLARASLLGEQNANEFNAKVKAQLRELGAIRLMQDARALEPAATN